jgi:hypothetical protein
MGRVIVAIISSAGMTPLFTRTITRGKFVCGKTADGICVDAYPPAREMATTRKRMAAE